MTSAKRASAPRHHGTRRSALRLGLLVFAIALVARAGFGTFRLVRAEDPTRLEFPDENQYWLIASSIAAGEGLRDELGFRAGRMPLYPGLLALIARSENGVVLAKIAQWFVGAAAAVLCFVLGTRVLTPAAGLVAGLLVALDPFLIFFSSLLLTETIFVAALLLCWIAAAELIRPASAPLTMPARASTGDTTFRRWLLFGMAGALCVHARESTLLLIPALTALLLWRRVRSAPKEVPGTNDAGRNLLGAAVALSVVAASLVPWAVRNKSILGECVWLTTRGGISLYDGLQQGTQGESDLGEVKDAPRVQALGELERDAYFRRAAIDELRRDPARALRLAGMKLVRMWNPIPNVETYRSGLIRLISAAWTVPTFALSAIGIVLLLRSRADSRAFLVIFLLLPAIYLTAVHSVFVGSVRYRLGAVPMLHLLAAVALTRMVHPKGGESAVKEGQRAA